MVALPAATPNTAPVVGFTVAVDGALELQVPPPVAFVNVVVAPTQTDELPEMGPTVLFTANDIPEAPQPVV